MLLVLLAVFCFLSLLVFFSLKYALTLKTETDIDKAYLVDEVGFLIIADR